MPSNDDALIRLAMTQRRLIQFSLHGRLRVAEPHDYGVRNGVPQLLVYQIGGDSASGKLPNWRWVVLSQMLGLQVLDPMFRARPRAAPSWDRHFLSVDSEE
jgi:hypothetical protein